MKKLLKIISALFLTSLLSGCIVLSTEPFYTEDLITALPAIEGKWSLIRNGDKDIAEKYPQPWVFTDEDITTFDSDISSILDVRYFKINNVIFANISPSELDYNKEQNQWWTNHIIMFNSVCKVELSANSLSMTPLNEDWVGEIPEEKTGQLSSVDFEVDRTVLTSSSSELVLFLKKYGKNTHAFLANTSYKFRRIKRPKKNN